MAIKYLDSKRIEASGIGTELTGVGGWKEVGRTTLGSAGDNITVSSLADKRYYMCLAHPIASTSCQSQIQLGSGSIDTGTNYSGRFSNAGTADGTTVNDTDISISDTNSTTGFEVAYISNLSAKEKLVQCWNVLQMSAGAGNAPKRTESVGKWVNTSNPLDIVNWFNRNANNYNTGSELVVLGWDEDDTHSTNFWEELASVSGNASSTNLTTGTITAKKYLWYQMFIEDTQSLKMAFNNDAGTNYSRRYSINGGSDGTSTGIGYFGITANTTSCFINGFIINNSANEKLVISNNVERTSTGAGTAPERFEFVGKWANTSEQITEIDLNKSGSNFSSNSILKVWGSN